MSEWTAYIDESGNRTGAVDGSDYFVFAEIAGSPGTLDELTKRVRQLKLNLVPNTDLADWELHAGALFHDRDGSPLGYMGMDNKISVMRDIVDLVSDSDVALFGVAVMSKRLRRKNATAAKITKNAAALLVEQLESFVKELGNKTTLKIVSDSTHKKYRLAMERALSRRMTGRTKLPPGGRRHVTRIEFVDSRSSTLVQVADAIAYIIHRYIGGDGRLVDMFEAIERQAWISREKLGSGQRVGSTRNRRPWGGIVYVGLPWRGAKAWG